MFAITVCFGVMTLSNVFEDMSFLGIGLILLFTAVVLGAVYMNASKNVERK